MYLGATDPKVKMRQAIEAKIVRAVIKEALRQGYYLAVDNGDMTERMIPTRNKQKVIDAIMETDDDFLFFYKGSIQQGWIRFVYGNDGWDVISDYSSNPETESVIAPAMRIADQYD